MNEILRPEVLWIEGRCYRVNDPNFDIAAFQEHDLYENDMDYDRVDDEGDDDNFEVTRIDDSRYCTSLHVSKHYIGSIIGKKGVIKMRIERDTRTEIKIPRQGQSGDIVIFGSSESNVKAARRRINIIVISSRMKQKATHFLSIPLNTPEIIEKFEKFKESVLRNCPDRGLDETLFIKPNKLHLTIGVMCLMDKEERLRAAHLLTEAKQKIIKPMLENYLPLKLRLKGLSYMNDDPREIDVLYGLVQEEDAPSGLVQGLVDALVDHYYKAGFMERNERANVKLHVTFINSKYRKGTSRTSIVNNEEQRNAKKLRETFDGSGVLQKFVDFDFGVTELKEIHLSQRHCIASDGYYQPTCVVTCTTG
ncbi:activating signal cointegrator 1 complex subunit 1 [Pectinophora gossypiella]|uniref:activating signal cointegrator 1 complex subunit 1 n=1 Tax=Pectinophora gossypiella TaxID=13191 RepID=UPI00214E36EE|nr:activating signal cointegrator 1 complex subunit 1 [Pectinophora gossypiella]